MEAPCPKHKIRDGPVGSGGGGGVRGGDGGGGGGGLGVLQLLQLEDRRLQAAGFLLVWGCSMVIYGTVMNRSANPKHIFLGFLFFTMGAAIAFLTLCGGGRAAARAERFLRTFF